MAPSTCGDGICDGDETDSSCAVDCGCTAIAEEGGSCVEEETPGHCFCSPDCLEGGDCCADACDVCGVCDMPDACATDADCDDGNACTVDSCAGQPKQCSNNASAAAGAPCDDDDDCTADDVCDGAGNCVGEPVEGLMEVIDFEGLIGGEVVSSVDAVSGLGPIHVFGTNSNFDEGTNAALAFDSACIGGCTGADTDLGTPNEDFGGPGIGEGGEAGSSFRNSLPQGKIAIIAENLVDDDGDGLVDDPDDQGGGAVGLTFDFSTIGPVSVHEITVIDVETTEMMPLVEMFDGEGNLVQSQTLPATGNNGVASRAFEVVGGVVTLTITARGSVGVDDIVFETEECLSPTTTTSTTSISMLDPTSSTTSTSLPQPVAEKLQAEAL
jgi:hypothetical protein